MTITTRSSNFRHPITIEEKTGTKGETGAKTVTWSTFITTRAAIWPKKGKEIVIDNKLTMQTLFTIRIRYQPGITPAMRIKFGTRYFYIEQMPNTEERNVVLDLVCREDV
jgi:SPP1 family predicted phage head-tail adaptor